MSAQHAPHEASEWVDDREITRVPADAPIRSIAPDDFVARSSEQTFRAALRKLERETSRRESQYPRCPACGSINIRRKSTHAVVTRQVDAKFRCAKQGCREHFDELDPPRDAEIAGEQATLREVTRE
jgi:hypothetical protein